MDKWESIADRKIREAMESGAFDNLPNRGKPIPLDRNPFEDPSLWMAHHLLRVNGFAPAWIDEAREIDESTIALRSLLREASSKAVDEFRDRARELNRRILSYNLTCPSAQFHKRPIAIDAEIQRARRSGSKV